MVEIRTDERGSTGYAVRAFMWGISSCITIYSSFLAEEALAEALLEAEDADLEAWTEADEADPDAVAEASLAAGWK